MGIDKLNQERLFLNQLDYGDHVGDEPYLVLKRKYVHHLAQIVLRGDALELGCSDGFMTKLIADSVSTLDVVDASESNIDLAKNNAPANATFYEALFEEFEPKKQYDVVIASYIFEHILEVPLILKKIYSWIKPNGILFAVVPNCRALSRQLALKLNFITDLKELTPNDLKSGHRRVYDTHSFNKDITECGFKIVNQGGLIFKILADFQLNQLLENGFFNEEHIEGLFQLGLEYPDFADSMFVIARKQ